MPLKTRLGQTLCQGSCRDLLPAADHVEALGQGRQEARDLVRVVLQVGVEGEDDLAAGGAEAGRQRGRLAEVAAEADAVDARVAPGQLGMTSQEPSRLPSSTKMTSRSRPACAGDRRRSRRAAVGRLSCSL